MAAGEDILEISPGRYNWNNQAPPREPRVAPPWLSDPRIAGEHLKVGQIIRVRTHTAGRHATRRKEPQLTPQRVTAHEYNVQPKKEGTEHVR